jgi:D-proline reductase (dithiol) PrdB
VGLLAREIEARGVTTVGLALVKEVAVAARAPRFLYLHWPFGHALGEPGNVAQQRTVLHDMLAMATGAPRPGLVLDLPYRWRRETYPPIADWGSPSDALASAFAMHDDPRLVSIHEMRSARKHEAS